MTDNTLADITLVIDRSGSMGAIKDEAQSGINAFIQEQAKAQGRANLTLVQFDTEYEFVHHGVPIGDVPPYTLEPRGMTALLDAVGRTVDEVGRRLAALPEHGRPGVVVCAIVTDGQENSSRTYTRQRVREMISHQRDAYNWQFVFLGADDHAFDEATSMGIHADAVAQYDPSRVHLCYAVVSNMINRRRVASLSGIAPEALKFTAEERNELASAQSPKPARGSGSSGKSHNAIKPAAAKP